MERRDPSAWPANRSRPLRFDMPVPRPSLPKLIEQLASEMESRLPGILPRSPQPGRRAGTRVFRRSGCPLQVPRAGVYRPGPTSVTRTSCLVTGAVGVLQKTAAPATGSLLIGGENGASLMAGSVFQRADGVQFTVDVGVTIVGSSATVAITADEVGCWQHRCRSVHLGQPSGRHQQYGRRVDRDLRWRGCRAAGTVPGPDPGADSPPASWRGQR